jgi:integrase
MSGLTPLQFKKLIQEASENLEADLAMTRASESTQTALEYRRVEMYTLEEYWNSEDGEFEVTPAKAFIRLASQPDYEGESIENILGHWNDVFERCGIDRNSYSHETQWRVLEELLLVYYPWVEKKFFTIKANMEKNKGQRLSGFITPDYLQPSRLSVNSQAVSAEIKSNKRVKSLPVLSEVYKQFLDFKPDLKSKMRDSYNRYIEILIALIGDKSIDKIDRKCLKKALSRIEELPAKNRKPYNKMSWSEILDIEVPESDFIAKKTVKDHVKFWQTLFAYVMKETEYIEVSPTANIQYSVDSRKDSYAPLSDVEVGSILKQAKSSDRYWWYILCTLAAYTGARKGELLALKPNDFKKDDDTGRAYFYIAASKTDAGRRKVPIALSIRDEVVNYIDSISDNEPLFPEGKKKEKQLVNWIRDSITEMGNELVSDQGRRKVFHSFRHSFITKARSLGNELSLVQAVVGHEQSNTGQTQIYTNEYPLGAVLCVVDSVSYGKLGGMP